MQRMPTQITRGWSASLMNKDKPPARAMGDAFRRLKIPIGRVLSSPTYRALEAVKLAKLGPPTVFPELGQSEQGMPADDSGTRAA
jgi:hypothetical protein